MGKILRQIIDHTLKTPDGRWSRMSIIITSAWLAVIVLAILDFCKEGFRYDVWITFVGVAVGTKLVDAQAKKVEANENPK